MDLALIVNEFKEVAIGIADDGQSTGEKWQVGRLQDVTFGTGDPLATLVDFVG